MKTANTLIQMARDIRELVAACGASEWVEGQNQTTYSKHGDDTWYVITDAKIRNHTVYVKSAVSKKWFMLREYRLRTAQGYTVLYRTYATQAEAEQNAADVRKNGSPCVARLNPDQSNPYACWAIFVQPLEEAR
jgi:hypothetical protein